MKNYIDWFIDEFLTKRKKLPENMKIYKKKNLNQALGINDGIN